MINKVGQIMVYVKNQDEVRNFWTEKVGFCVRADESNDHGMRWIEIAPSKEAATSIILHDKELIAKLSPGVNLGTPSLMFFTEDIDTLHNNLVNKQVTVGDIVHMPGGRVCNFADNEGNYFAVMEKSK